MNKISLYILLILTFLGLSKSFSPSEKRTQFFVNEKMFSNYFQGSPLSVILLDSFEEGFLIKTYFQRYKIVHGFKQPEMMTVRISKAFYDTNLINTGMSIFRRAERESLESTTAMPPGTLYIGDPAYGYWERSRRRKKRWLFHRAYRHFPDIFKWGKFRPTIQFYNISQTFLKHEKSFYGDNKQFGHNGSVTKKNIISKYKTSEVKEISILKHLAKLLKIPKWSKN